MSGSSSTVYICDLGFAKGLLRVEFVDKRSLKFDMSGSSSTVYICDLGFAKGLLRVEFVDKRSLKFDMSGSSFEPLFQ